MPPVEDEELAEPIAEKVTAHLQQAHYLNSVSSMTSITCSIIMCPVGSNVTDVVKWDNITQKATRTHPVPKLRTQLDTINCSAPRTNRPGQGVAQPSGRPTVGLQIVHG